MLTVYFCNAYRALKHKLLNKIHDQTQQILSLQHHHNLSQITFTNSHYISINKLTNKYSLYMNTFYQVLLEVVFHTNHYQESLKLTLLMSAIIAVNLKKCDS